MTVGSFRSGLVESLHPASAVLIDSSGSIVDSLGDDLDRPFFLRSAPKPLQAAVANRFGADLDGEQLGVAASSHSGWPVHIALVEQMLQAVDLDVSALRCPPARPSAPGADRLWASRGRIEAERLFHNCSGKHAGMLRACVSQGWSLEYTNTEHPLQQEIVTVASEIVGADVGPVGVDGCGVPTLRTDAVGLARIFLALVTDADLVETSRVVARFTSLTADATRPEGRLARWLPAVVKGGAEGCLGIGLLEHGLAVGAKSWTGTLSAASVAAVTLLRRNDLVPDYQFEQRWSDEKNRDFTRNLVTLGLRTKF